MGIDHPGVGLVRHLGGERGVAPLIAEDAVVDAVGAQLLGYGHAEALAGVGLEHKAAQPAVDAHRPRDGRKPTVEPGRALHENRVGPVDGRLVPVAVTVYAHRAAVEAHARAQYEVGAQHQAPGHKRPEAQLLEVGQYEAPAAAPVDLALDGGPRPHGTHAHLLAHRGRGGERVLVEAALERAGRLGHVAVRHRLGALTPAVGLPPEAGLGAAPGPAAPGACRGREVQGRL